MVSLTHKPIHAHTRIMSHLDSFLLTNLSTDGDVRPQIQYGNELRESAQETAVTNCLGVLSEHIAGAEVRDDA